MADRTSPAGRTGPGGGPDPDGDGPTGGPPAGDGPEEVRVHGMSSDGRGVGRSGDGKVVFVAGALPGETVRVVSVDERASWRSGRLLEIVDPAPERQVPPCPRLAEGCGGCQWQHVSPPAQRRLKETLIADSLRRVGHLEPPARMTTVELPVWQFRTTFRAGVTAGRAALRHSRSHDLVPLEGCLIAHPAAAELLDGDRYGNAREVTIRVGAGTGDRLVALSPPGPAAVPDDVRSDHYHDRVAGRRWRVSAGSFFQSRTDGAGALAALVAEAADELGTPGRAVDLYSGVGLFAGMLAERGWAVRSVEGSRRSVADARVNLADLGVRIEHGDVNRWRPAPADLVVADPSRAGLGRDGVRAATGTGASRVVLISCDVASLGRDAGLLVGTGYRLASVTAVDMFPHSFHVEAVSIFDRA